MKISVIPHEITEIFRNFKKSHKYLNLELQKIIDTEKLFFIFSQHCSDTLGIFDYKIQTL